MAATASFYSVIIVVIGLLLPGQQAVSGQVCDDTNPVTIQAPGSWSSPNWPNSYPNSSTCLYNITVAVGHIIKLTFQSFSLGGVSSQCPSNDYVEIFNPRSSASWVSGIPSEKYCRSSIPLPIYSNGTWMKVKFQSNQFSSDDGRGFLATLTSLTENDICPTNGVFMNRSGTIHTPFYPRNYPHERQVCSWMILAPPGKHIKLKFKAFDILDCGYHCNCEMVNLRLGFASSADEPGRGMLCQEKLTPSDYDLKQPYKYDLGKTLYSISNDIHITFTNRGTSNHNNRGFSADYEIIDYFPPVCPPEIPLNYTDASGVIRSPNYPNNYPRSMHCLQLITVASGSRVKLNFTSFQLEGTTCSRYENRQCECDFVHVYDGDSIHDALIGKMCGDAIPKPVVSSGNQMLVLFKSDFAGHDIYKGFYAEYSTSEEKPSPTIATPTTPPTPRPSSEARAGSPDKFAVMVFLFVTIAHYTLVLSS